MMNKISIILPVYNGIEYIKESICSIQNQTYTNWELIVINEYNSDDGSAEVVKKFSQDDNRICLLQNQKRLGLADSLNLGIQYANGEYIARVDVDDPSYPERFEKQVDYLDKHPDVFLCGTLQRSVLPDRSYIQEVPTESEELKAAMLFGCEISHCSVMFRRKVFLESNMRYNPEKLGEDYDLWTKIMFKHKIVNLPEVLVDHRWGFDNISLDKGEDLKRESCETSAICLKQFGIDITSEDYILLSGWRNRPEDYARYDASSFLQKQQKLLVALYEKNCKLQLIDKGALRKIIFKRWNWACDCAGIFYQKVEYSLFRKDSVVPEVSIVLPIYHSVDTLRETIDSILVQEFEEWELIIISEAENNDGSLALAKMYSFFDSRIRVIENDKRLGLSESLNLGILLSQTDYIARIDDDDLANAKRIGTQYEYLKKNPQVGICQTYQHYFGGGTDDFIHRPPLKADEMKAKLLFFCDACHSTIMFRKHIFVENNLWYSGDCYLEDYELWTRAVRFTQFVTIPEVYGEYRVGRNNISRDKTAGIEHDMIEIIAAQLEENLNIAVPEYDKYILNGWNNIFVVADPLKKQQMLDKLKELLQQIWERNTEVKFYAKNALLETIAAKWRWSKYNEPWQGKKNAKSIEEALELPMNSRQKMVFSMKKICLLCYRFPVRIIQRIFLGMAGREIMLLEKYIQEKSERQEKIQRNCNDETRKQIEKWTWERYKRTEKLLEEIKLQNTQIQTELAQLNYRQNLIPYYEGEKIRIVFLFQIASFWPAWDSFYEECLKDIRMDVKFVFLDETATEDAQMESARKFLEESKIDYIEYDEFDIEKFEPHVMVIQTPYDNWHRRYAHWSINFRTRGIRLVYIPYGIEISDTEDSHKLHFHTMVIDNCWRIYTFSERMRRDYLRHTLNRNAVRALGLPRFDSLYNRKRFVLNKEIKKRAMERKIVLWKLHFPKEIFERGKIYSVTPPLEEYIEFAKHMCDYNKDLFFIVMPHPRFKSKKTEDKIKRKINVLFNFIISQENVFVDERDDYRESLVNADYIMIDRSAVMVEAGALGVPVLYLYNKNYNEPVTEAIQPLINSYYHGNSCSDMLEFLDMCRNGQDTLKESREKAFKECIPFFDGRNGWRIKEDIIRDLKNNIL